MTSKAGHTAGPWKVEIIGSPRVLAASAKGGDFPICDVRGWGYLTGKGHGALGLPHDEAVAIQNANTHLIAAAPDLLEVCQDLWCAFSDTDDPVLRTIAINARAALSKATAGGAV